MLFLCLAGCQLGSRSIITTVEHGLRHSVLIANDKNQHMTITERMNYYNVQAVSIAVINNEKLEWAKGYGCSSNTLFQAASMSKSFTAIGALILVQQKKLSLDENVNNYLKSWKVPDNKFTKTEKVTLRRLLSHSAGINLQRGFAGYSSDAIIPTTVEILEGKKPLVNSDPIQVIQTPGIEVHYSGGGTTIVQLLIEDVTGEKFDVWMKNNVLIPFGMHASTFSQPLPQEYSNHAICGHKATGKQVPGKWHVYPEMAPAGLWSTPTEIAHFIIMLFKILHGKQDGPISQELLRDALKIQVHNSNMGLGFKISGSGKNVTFGHGGWNEGFIADFNAWPELGKGLIMMVNNEGAVGLMHEIRNSIADAYDIPGFEPLIKSTIPLDPSSLAQFTGVYKQHDHTITINMRNNRLFLLDSYVDLLRDMQLYPAGDDNFFTKELNGSLQFFGSHGQIDSIIMLDKDGKRMIYNGKEIVLKKSKA